MKKLIIWVLLMLCCLPLAGKKEPIQIFYNSKLVGEMQVEEFEALLKASKNYSREIEAEKDKRVKIILKEDPYVVKVGQEFETEITITWEDEKGNVFKTLTLVHKIKLKKESYSKFRIIYRDTAEIATPVLIVIVILLAIIL